MELPSTDAIAGRAKRRKSDGEALLNAYDTLASIYRCSHGPMASHQ